MLRGWSRSSAKVGVISTDTILNTPTIRQWTKTSGVRVWINYGKHSMTNQSTASPDARTPDAGGTAAAHADITMVVERLNEGYQALLYSAPGTSNWYTEIFHAWPQIAEALERAATIIALRDPATPLARGSSDDN